ncbi:MAG: flagellar motor protein MotB [Planctomycetes bacterium]|nr:flagellar motor protein MotB [Planctomycetota bacterium]
MPRKKEQPAGVPDWMVTFGDLNSLLMTFFVMLFSLSEIKKDKLGEVAESLGGKMQVESTIPETEPMSSRQTFKQIILELSKARFSPYEKEGGTQIKSPFGQNTKVEFVREGLKVTIGGKAAFAHGSAELTEEARQVLLELAKIVAGVPNKLEVRGHATTIPIDDEDSPYRDDPDRFRLAHDRALAVARFLIDEGGIAPERLRVTAAGKYEPVRDNILEAGGRAQNRRVEVIVTEEQVAPAPAQYERQ